MTGKPYENHITIKSWAEEDRPREKLAGQGRRALTDAELIAILIGSGNRDESAVELSKRILHHYDNDLNQLGKASIDELCNFKGIGEAKAISIIAALEVGRRRNDTETKPIERIGGSKDAPPRLLLNTTAVEAPIRTSYRDRPSDSCLEHFRAEPIRTLVSQRGWVSRI